MTKTILILTDGMADEFFPDDSREIGLKAHIGRCACHHGNSDALQLYPDRLSCSPELISTPREHETRPEEEGRQEKNRVNSTD